MSDNSNSGGIGVTGLLGVAFIVLKLCHVIDWDWWVVLLPFEVTAAIALVVFLVVILLRVKHRGDVKYHNQWSRKRFY